jgi:competence ComEA-like helix-hairpin-helix protein
VLRWPIRLASVIALTVLAYGWGDWWRERPLLDGILLALLSVVLLIAVSRLYRPGGLAAFEDTSGRAPREAITAPADAPRESRRERLARREREKRDRQAGEQRERRAARVEPVAPAPATREAGRPRARERESGGSLWSDPATAVAGPGGARPAGDPLDLNTATADDLAVLPGIGRGAAGRVVEHRAANGPFSSVEQLAEVEGFDAARVARVAGRLRV